MYLKAAIENFCTLEDIKNAQDVGLCSFSQDISTFQILETMGTNLREEFREMGVAVGGVRDEEEQEHIEWNSQRISENNISFKNISGEITQSLKGFHIGLLLNMYIATLCHA